MKLIIKQSSWSGRTPDYKPQEIEKEYELNLNAKYVIATRTLSHVQDGDFVNEEEEVLSFNITEVTDDSIKITTYQPFSDNDNGSINLRSDKKEFVISTDKPLKLMTPTMDYGDIFIFTLVK